MEMIKRMEKAKSKPIKLDFKQASSITKSYGVFGSSLLQI
jgi:hypothetical protein